MPSSLDVADYFPLHGKAWGQISNLKIQKMVYYAGRFQSGSPAAGALFPEKLEAWMHGPVVPDLYRRFSQFGSSAIPPPSDFNPDVFSTKQQTLLNEVFDVYGRILGVETASVDA